MNPLDRRVTVLELAPVPGAQSFACMAPGRKPTPILGRWGWAWSCFASAPGYHVHPRAVADRDRCSTAETMPDRREMALWAYYGWIGEAKRLP
jgi:hypothetical protein